MIWCASDTTAAVAWANNGSTSSNAPSAFLLQMLGQLNQGRCFNLHAFHVSGDTNTLADALSRRFDLSWSSLCDPFFAAHPQVSWQPVQQPSEIISKVHSALFRSIWEKDYQPGTPPPSALAGKYGSTSVTPFSRTHTSTPVPTPYPYCNSLPANTAQGNWLPSSVQSQLKQWQKPFVPWGRRWPHWDAQTPGSLRKVPWTFGLPANWQPMPKTTHLPIESNQYRSPSYARRWNTGSWPTHQKPRQ
jgi:hypothetical protein